MFLMIFFFFSVFDVRKAKAVPVEPEECTCRLRVANRSGGIGEARSDD
jgi:hypothetical protein